MRLTASPLPRFQGVSRTEQPKGVISLPFEHGGQKYWATGDDMLQVAEANLKFCRSGILFVEAGGKNTFVDVNGDHQDATHERNATFKRLSEKA